MFSIYTGGSWPWGVDDCSGMGRASVSRWWAAVLCTTFFSCALFFAPFLGSRTLFWPETGWKLQDSFCRTHQHSCEGPGSCLRVAQVALSEAVIMLILLNKTKTKQTRQKDPPKQITTTLIQSACLNFLLSFLFFFLKMHSYSSDNSILVCCISSIFLRNLFVH